MEQVRVNGPIYSEISGDSKFHSDLAPPPLFVVESMLILHQMLGEPSLLKRREMVEKFETLESQFVDRNRQLEKELENVESIRDPYRGNVASTAREFFDEANRFIVPKLLKDQPEIDSAGINAKLSPIFDKHRDYVQQLLSAVDAKIAQQEGVASNVSQQTLKIQIVLGMTLCGFFVILAWWINRGILTLQEESDRMALVPGFSASSFLITDRDANILWVNEGFTKLTGKSLIDCRGKSALDYLTADRTDPQSRELLRAAMSTGTACHVEVALRSRADSELICDTEVQPTRSANGKVNGFIAIQVDVSERAQLRRRLESTIDALSEGIVVQDASGRIIDCNTSAEKILGLTRDEILQRESEDPRWMSIHEDGSPWDGTSHPSMETLRTGVPINGAIMGLRLPNGHKRWISINTQPIRGADGNVTSVVSSFSDLSDLREEKQRLELMIEGAGLGTWERDLQRDTIQIGGSLSKLFGNGTERTEIGMDAWLSRVHPEDRRIVEQALHSHLFGSDSEYRAEFRLWTDRGTAVWILESGRVVERDHSSRPTKVSGISIDISHSKGMETQIRESERNFRMILENTLDGVVSMNQEGEIVGWNPQAESIFGWSSSEAAGRPLSELIIPAELRSAHETGLQRFLASGKSQMIGKRVQVPAVRKDGERITIELALSMIRKDRESESENEIVFTAFMRNITQEKRLEMQLAESQRLESIGQLAAGVAHEINTPVQFVNDSVHFVKDGLHDLLDLIEHYQSIALSVKEGKASPDLAERVSLKEEEADLGYLVDNLPSAVERSLEGLDRISQIVRSMKTFAHRGPKEKAFCDINSALQATLTIARNEYRSHADVETDFGEIPEVLCNAGEINQVFLNLIVNAAHAIQELNQTTGKRGTISIKTQTVGEWLEIAIRDSGVGMPEDVRHRIFEPFFTTKKVGTGTGQGLAIVHHIVVNNHQGEIDVESMIGRGTTFKIRIPLLSQTVPMHSSGATSMGSLPTS